MPPASASSASSGSVASVPAPGPSASAMGSTMPIFIGRWYDQTHSWTTCRSGAGCRELVAWVPHRPSRRCDWAFHSPVGNHIAAVLTTASRHTRGPHALPHRPVRRTHAPALAPPRCRLGGRSGPPGPEPGGGPGLLDAGADGRRPAARHDAGHPPRAKPGGGALRSPGPRGRRRRDPQAATGKVYFEMGGGAWICSGAVATDSRTGYSLVLTAGHCAVDADTGSSPRTGCSSPRST